MRPIVRTLGRIATPLARGMRTLTPARLTVVGWHRIGDADDGLTTRPEDFKHHLDVLEAWGAQPLRLDEAARLLDAGELPDRAVVLTFDDGYASVLETAWPELQRRGMPATLYAVSGYLHGDRTFPWDAHLPADSPLRRLVTADELRDAADSGLDIGSHTVSHRWLPSLSPSCVAEEVGASRRSLEDLLQRPVTSFAYPMGGWTPAIRDQVEAAGYDLAITVDRGRNPGDQDRHALRRAFAFDRPDDVLRQLEGGFTWVRPLERRRSRREPTW